MDLKRPNKLRLSGKSGADDADIDIEVEGQPRALDLIRKAVALVPGIAVTEPRDTLSLAESTVTGGNPFMAAKFKVGDHVRWNSEAGHVCGRIIKIHTRDTEYKGHPRYANEDEPQYEIKSDKTDHVAMHKGSALHRID